MTAKLRVGGSARELLLNNPIKNQDKGLAGVTPIYSTLLAGMLLTVRKAQSENDAMG